LPVFRTGEAVGAAVREEEEEDVVLVVDVLEVVV